MPDVTLVDVSKGVESSWAAAGASVTNIVPANRVYFQRAAEGTPLPYCVYSFDDVSAFYGGTEYFSGSAYIKKTRVKFSIYTTREYDVQTLATAVNDAFGWETADPAMSWTIPNAVVLAAVPEVEKMELTEERVGGEDIIRYDTSFTLILQSERG